MNSLPDFIPSNQWYNIVQPLTGYFPYITSSDNEDVTVKDVIYQYPFAQYFEFLDNVMSKPWFAPYTDYDLVEYLRELRTEYDEIINIGPINTIKSDRSISTSLNMTSAYKKVDERLSTLEKKMNIYRNYNIRDYYSEIDCIFNRVYNITYRLYNNIYNTHTKLIDNQKKLDLFKKICVLKGCPYDDEFYAMYNEWRKENPNGNRYQAMNNFITLRVTITDRSSAENLNVDSAHN
jgi:hypothetical protein